MDSGYARNAFKLMSLPEYNGTIFMPPFEEAGVYCFALVGRSVRRSVRRPHFCPEHNSKSISGIIFKLHRWIDLIKEKCSAQES